MLIIINLNIMILNLILILVIFKMKKTDVIINWTNSNIELNKYFNLKNMDKIKSDINEYISINKSLKE